MTTYLVVGRKWIRKLSRNLDSGVRISVTRDCGKEFVATFSYVCKVDMKVKKQLCCQKTTR
jgi:hypothetical protein